MDDRVFVEAPFGDLVGDPKFPDMEKAYRAESGHKDYLDGVLNKEFYYNAQEAGILGVYLLRVNGELAGFFTLMFNEVPHATKLSATVESFYIDKPFRGHARWVLSRLVEAARKRGAPGVLVTAPVGSRMDRWMSLLHVPPAYACYYVGDDRADD